MQAFKSIYLFSLCSLILLGACKRDVFEKRVYDNVIYEVNPVTLYLNNAQKTKQKTSLQYISILYSNLFNQNISAQELNELSEVFLSIGDKGIANSLALNRFLTLTGIQIPSNQQMRDDIPQFVSDTYLKFFLRNPTPYEAYQLKKMIADDLAITPEMVYAAFALSNEYNFY
jgi:hypothetical protein